ncbi:Serine/threonine-protein kinase ULK2 [Aphelenchoides avenae]|nr:Serine/threonine-protein kinase ULK2 [Aphelenchus avenae]
MDPAKLANLRIAEEQLNGYTNFFCLGSGSFGCVFGCLRKAAPDKSVDFLAVKQLPLCRDSDDYEDTVKRYKIEMESMMILSKRSKYFVNFLDYEVSDTHAYIFMEFCEAGNLEQYLNVFGPLHEATMKQLFQQIGECLVFMKQEKIYHRDLKPTNIVLCTKDPPGPIDANSWNYNVKVADFGTATFAEQIAPGSNAFYGDAKYASPEAIKAILQSQTYDSKSDMFMVGIILYQCATGRLPFKRPKDLLCLSDQELELLAKGQNYERPDDLSAQLMDLVEKVLETERKKRLDTDEFLLHPWFTGVDDAAPPDEDEDLATRLSRSLGSGRNEHSLSSGSLMQSTFDVVICGYRSIATSLISGSFSMTAIMAAKKMFRPYLVDVGSGVVQLNIRTHPVWLHYTRGVQQEADWDFNAHARATLCHAHAVIFVYDTANRMEFENTRNCIESAACWARKNCVFALVGNSVTARKWVVSSEEAEAAALAKRMFHRNVSAESGQGIELLYRDLGKTSLIYRLVKDDFSPAPEITLGAGYFSKTLDVDGVNVRLNVWDTAGQERLPTK